MVLGQDFSIPIHGLHTKQSKRKYSPQLPLVKWVLYLLCALGICYGEKYLFMQLKTACVSLHGVVDQCYRHPKLWLFLTFVCLTLWLQ